MADRLKLNSPNSFCWIELACRDMTTAKEFYGSLMGWKFKDTKAGGGVYSNIKLGDKGLVGGLYEFALPEEPKKKKQPKIPSFWGSYIATKDIKASTKKAQTLGGTLVADITDLGDTGYMSVVQDPVGALFGLWQAKKLNGFGPDREDIGASGWNELQTSDEKSSVNFYSKLFNWKISTRKVPNGTYTTFTFDKKPVAGMMKCQDTENIPPYWLVYFNVKDCDKSTNLAMEKGAKVVMSPTSIKGAGRLSMLSDSEGAMFALIKYDPS